MARTRGSTSAHSRTRAPHIAAAPHGTRAARRETAPPARKMDAPLQRAPAAMSPAAREAAAVAAVGVGVGGGVGGGSA